MRSKSLGSLLLSRSSLLVPAVMVSALCFSSAHAQTFYGSVVGTAADTSGAVVAGATVTLTNLGTNGKQTSVTDSAGDYRFLNLVPATYRIEVEGTGFKRFVRTPVQVQVDTATRVNAAMQLGSVTETVEVTTNPPLLQTESGSLGGEIEGKTLQETPLNGRNALNLMELVPGVVPQGNTSGGAGLNTGTSTSSAAWGNYQIGGGMPLQSAMYIDGAPINIMNKNFTAMVPTQDVIQEFKVETSATSPEFGRFGGGVINMTTKSGGNTFHGTVYEYFRNSVLNANYFFSKRAGAARAAYNQNQFGGAVSGPIWKDKAFFFFGYEQLAIRQGVPVSTNVPTAALRAGVFTTAGMTPAAAAAYKVSDPQGICNVQPYTGQMVNGQTFASGGYYITNLYGAGLKAGTTCGDSLGKILSAFYPLPNASLTGYNYFTQEKVGTNGHQMTGRIDYALSSKQRIFGRFTLWPLIDLAPQILPITGAFNTTGSQTHNHTNQVTVGDTISITPTTLLDVRLDYLRQYGDAIPPLLQSGNVDESQFGANYAALAPYMTYKNLPFATFSGGTEVHNFFNFTYNNLTRTYYNNYHLSGGITKILGRHTIKAGAEGRLIQREDVGSDQNSSGTYAFSNKVTGDEWAGLLTGAFDTGTITTVKAVTSFNWYKGFYVGDTWQVSSKLTANLGIRWELPGAIAENHDNDTVLLPNSVDPYTGIKGTVSLVNSVLYSNRTTLVPHNNLFGPRVGLAYRVTEKTVVRAGYALAYLPPDLQIGAYANASPVNTASTINTNTAASVGYTLSNPFPATTQYPNGFQAAPGRSNPAFMSAYIGQAVTAPYPFAAYPASQSMNLSVGQQIGNSLLVDVGFAHTLGTHLPSLANGLDQVPDSAISSLGAGLIAASPTTLSYNGVKLPTAYQTVGQSLRPFPAYTNYSNNAGFYGTTSYNALEVKAQKRFGAAGQIGLAYTWMKMIGDTDTILTSQEAKSGGVAGAGEGALQDYTNPKGDRSLYSYDAPNRLVVNYQLNLPFGKGQRFAAGAHGITGAVISGWAANGISTFQTGYPVYLYVASSNLTKYFGAGTVRPNYTAGCNKNVSGSAYNRLGTWFNTSCFTNPGLYAFGNEPRTDGAIKSSGQNNWDFSLVKATPIHESIALQLRFEFFNIFNRTQFGPPVTAQDNTLFGQVSTQANAPRSIQVAARINF